MTLKYNFILRYKGKTVYKQKKLPTKQNVMLGV